MSGKQFFRGFTDAEQAEYEQEAMTKYDPETVQTAAAKWKSYTPAEKQRIADEGNAILQALLDAMPQGASSLAAQSAVERWRRNIESFWTPDLDQLLGLANMYNEDPRFKANYDTVHPDLAAFMREAVTAYVNAKKK